MGLGSKLGAKNLETEKILDQSGTNIVQYGYNTNSLNFPTMPGMTTSEKQQLDNLRTDIRTQTPVTHYPSGLIKPTIPLDSDPDRTSINELVVEKMWRIVMVNGLQGFFTQARLQQLVNRACSHDYRLLQKQWGIATIDMTTDLAVMGLYDIIIFGDDSGSMATEEPSEDYMTRHALMKEVVKTLSFWATLMDEDGVVIRFFNSEKEGNGISNASEVENLFRMVKPAGSTPMGRMLRYKIFDKIIYPALTNNSLDRPVLIITVTDGKPDSEQDVVNEIINMKNRIKGTKYGEHGVAFSFAQIGKDTSATVWLASIDTHPVVGNMIDCTSEYSIEKKECEKKYGVEFTEATWLVKLMIGAIDPEYDAADETPVTQTISNMFTNFTSKFWGNPPPYTPPKNPFA